MQTRILLVEDNTAVAESMIAALEIRGHMVKWAISVDDAEALLDNVDFDLAIVDLQLGDRLGVELFPLPKGLLGCVCSGLPDTAEQELRAAGINDVTVFSKGDPVGVMEWVAANQRREEG